MLAIDKTSRIPIYEQIVEGIARQIATGLLKEGEKLPSVRELSLLLDANPNTVQKAITELDRIGLVVSYPGRGCFVAVGARVALHERGRAKLKEMLTLAHELHLCGFSKQELIHALSEAVDTTNHHE